MHKFVEIVTHLASSCEIYTASNHCGAILPHSFELRSFGPLLWAPHVPACTSFITCYISCPAMHLSNIPSSNRRHNSSFKIINLVLSCLIFARLAGLLGNHPFCRASTEGFAKHQLALDPSRCYISFHIRGLPQKVEQSFFRNYYFKIFFLSRR